MPQVGGTAHSIEVCLYHLGNTRTDTELEVYMSLDKVEGYALIPTVLPCNKNPILNEVFNDMLYFNT
ncbi:MAG: hypothetical protein COX32_02290 [Candidatus Moranbacteria bacterium CG23_combo_of_CG06-09_8_20_14_all_41_28]|nr:MAG: hypothetical protein COX32_02290 [Candidatus Moranbacteria bacterium CG23_combo_of_CG06-09_8_20_14_all_41_28]